MERVVITGMGVVSSLGNDVNVFWDHIRHGISGISTIDTFDTSAFSTKIAGLVRDFDAVHIVGKKEARKMDRFCQFAVAASKQAINDAGLVIEEEDRGRIGVYIGSGIGGIQTILENHRTMIDRGPSRVNPALVPMMIANMASSQVSILFGLKGPTMSHVSACATSNNAIGEAFKLIQRGGADIIIAGGAEAAITDLALAGFGNAKALSTRNDEPTRASRPFDRDRDGFVASEGAGILVLESLEHALKRGATIHAEVIGYGSTSDAYHMVATDVEGLGAYQAMKEAVDDANISIEEIDYINAHATSTPVGDLSETIAIKKLLGKRAYEVPVSAIKSMVGHMLGAAGGVEAIALVKTLQENIIPPTINLENSDPGCDLDYVPNEAREQLVEIGISNSIGFGGHNAVLVLKKFG
ncbi:beta-ketoacyl-ACP synthase II [Shimazuella sp. AN120528]|uniref:beta-ketoacyl-ACP synthase II n=1 Tax=Shimazuella soli TaxID=1892854 RepID=UPI001F0F61F1|nr:beta-ketoacyl-ACP synthase II [Shimazuella soli]MCH5585584.1 beta-ketoacyl-ACP synthase II [Shimazuella soli]